MEETHYQDCFVLDLFSSSSSSSDVMAKLMTEKPGEEEAMEMETPVHMLVVFEEENAMKKNPFEFPKKQRSFRRRINNKSLHFGQSPLHVLASVASQVWEQEFNFQKYPEFSHLPVVEEVHGSTEKSKKKMEAGIIFPSAKHSGSVSEVVQIMNSTERQNVSRKRGLDPEYSDQTERREKVAKKKTIYLKTDSDHVIPEMSAELRRQITNMGGHNMQLVIQKELFATDLNVNNGRLSIPCNQAKTDFLTQDEKSILEQHVTNTRMRGIDVLVIDPYFREFSLTLKKWKMSSNFVYNLNKNWNSLVKQNKLEAHDIIQLWSFRVPQVDHDRDSLCFALVRVEKGEEIANESRASTIQSVLTT